MPSSASWSARVLELAEDFLARYRTGERRSLREYADRHPDLAAQIRQVFPAMAMLENIAVHDPSAAGDAAGPGAPGARPPAPRLGDFRIIREVGRGGMGVVYEAEQVSLGRHVALKVLPPHAHDAEQHRRFEREARAAARLHHTNIVPVFGVGEQDGQPFYVMQFIQGLGLDAVLAELQRLAGDAPRPPATSGGGAAAALAHSLATGGFTPAPRDQLAVTRTAAGGPPDAAGPPVAGSAAPSRVSTASAALSLSSTSAALPGQAAADPGRKATYWQSVAQIGIQVANALEYAHRQGVLHRDVKPSNLLLDLRGTVWVTDFGLAKAEGQQDLTHTGALVGTLRYMPPEAFDGRADARSDVYSLGLTLYELVALRRAFVEKDRHRLMKLITTTDPPRLDRLVPTVPRDLATIVHKAVAREPARRYQTAGELAADLQRLADDRPIRARPVGPLERAWRWGRRNPVVAGLTAAVVLLLVTGSAVSAVLGVTATAARDRADASAREAIENARKVAEERNKALAERERADREADTAWAMAYVVRLNSVQVALENSNLTQALDLLRLVAKPPPRRRTSPGWEWQYHWRTCNNELRALAGHRGDMGGLAVNTDGTRLVTCADDKTVREWDPATGKELRRLDGFSNPCLALSADGSRLAVGCHTGEVTIFDAGTWQELHRFRAHGCPVRGLAFSPDGARLAIAGEDRTVKVWGVAGGRELLTFAGHTDIVRGVAFSPDGRWLASAGEDATVRLWDAATAEPVHTLHGHAPGLICVAFSPDGKVLAAAGRDWVVRTWDPATGRELHTLTGHTSEVRALAFSPDGKLLASGGHDRVVKVWDLAAARERTSCLGHRAGLYGLAFSPDGRWLASASSDGTARLWSVTRETGGRADKSHTDQVRAVAFGPDGRWLASVGLDGKVVIRDVATGQARTLATDPAGGLLGLAVSPDGRYLAASGNAGLVTAWEVATGGPRFRVQVHTSWVSSLAFSPDGQVLATGSHDRAINLLDAASGRVLKTLTGHKGEIKGLAFGADGRRLYSGCTDETIKVWDLASDREVQTLKGHTDAVNGIALSRDGRRLASVSSDRTAKVWDLDSGQVLRTLTGHNDTVWSVAFIGDGARLVTTGWDQSVRVWDAETGLEVASLKGHTDRVLGLAVSPDGGQLATAGGRDLTVRVWDGRPLTDATRLEREAVDVLNFLFSRPLRKADVIAHLNSDASLRPELRRLAVGLADRYGGGPDARTFYEAAWGTLRHPHANAAMCRFALAQMGAACDLAPDDRRYRAGLGAAQYRLGRFRKEFLPKAAATLGRCDPDDPISLALLAMTRHRLEEKDQARASLARLRLLLNAPGGSRSADAEDLGREAALLTEGRKGPPAN